MDRQKIKIELNKKELWTQIEEALGAAFFAFDSVESDSGNALNKARAFTALYISKLHIEAKANINFINDQNMSHADHPVILLCDFFRELGADVTITEIEAMFMSPEPPQPEPLQKTVSSLTFYNGSAIDYSEAPLRLAGEVYEEFADCSIKTLRGKKTKVIKHKSEGRRKTGSYYTPSKITHETVEKSLSPIIQRLHQNGNVDLYTEYLKLKIIDPSAGCGFFLLEAAEYLFINALGDLNLQRAESPHSFFTKFKDDIIAKTIYGIELDPFAAAIARATLFAFAADSELSFSCLENHITVGDALELCCLK